MKTVAICGKVEVNYSFLETFEIVLKSHVRLKNLYVYKKRIGLQSRERFWDFIAFRGRVL